MSYPGTLSAVSIKDSANLDAFSRLRVSNAHILLSSVFDYDKRPLVWDEALSGGGTSTFLPNERSITLDVGTADGDQVIRQTKQYFTYRTGNSQVLLATFGLATPKVNLTQRVGYFDDENGLFLELADSTLNVVTRSFVTGSAVDTAISQASWNIDPMDGTGPSGLILDMSKVQILVIDMQWLGVGRCRFGFDLNGVIHYVHAFMNANTTLATVYMTTGTLPVRYEVLNTGITASASALKQICSSVLREGGEEEPGIQRAADTGITPLTATTTVQTLVGIQIKADFIRTTLIPHGVDMLVTGSNPVHWQLILNPTLSGAPTWASVDASSVANDSTTTLTVTPGSGTVIDSGYIAGTQGGRGSIAESAIAEALVVVADIAGVSDELWLCVQSTSSTSATFGSLKYEEIR